MQNEEEQSKPPYWHRLLTHFEKRRYFYNGLTIPFIIGARQYFEPEFSLLSVEELINEFSQSPFHFNVLMCPELGEYVFRITEANEFGYSKIENWIIQDDSFSGATTVSDVISQLSDEYAECIDDGRYSRISGEWISFSLEDIQRIVEAINAY